MFIVRLDKIEGEGDFPCPKCSNRISPEDEEEKTYTIVDIVMGEGEIPENMLIKCKSCSSMIRLEGFEALAETEESRADISTPLPDSKPGFRTNHTITFDGKQVGIIAIDYATQEDVTAFKKMRTLKEGEPFKGTITIENKENTSPVKTEDLQEIVKFIKRKIKGLRDNDIYLIEIKDGRKSIIGRASQLPSEPLE
ncbi:MAG: hypothetical protein QG670_130 [Thermoproteota archaeon]|nr:hypothetical protein [Thermoproteota archaeon]